MTAPIEDGQVFRRIDESRTPGMTPSLHDPLAISVQRAASSLPPTTNKFSYNFHLISSLQ